MNAATKLAPSTEKARKPRARGKLRVFDVAMLMRSKLPCGELERLENRKPYIVAVGQRIGTEASK